jgi:hypothetical protein
MFLQHMASVLTADKSHMISCRLQLVVDKSKYENPGDFPKLFKEEECEEAFSGLVPTLHCTRTS